MREVEERATRVLESVPSWLWDGERLPVPVEEIADTCFGLLVRDVEDMTSAPGAPELEPGQSLSGLLLASRGEIWVSAEEARRWPPRRHFTIGHELGHWVMHRSGQQSLFCRSASVAEDAPRPEIPPIEEEASVFAAAVLMPEHLVRIHWVQLAGDMPAMCERFDASRRAMSRRLLDLLGVELDPYADG